jgi:hypothetical protein
MGRSRIVLPKSAPSELVIAKSLIKPDKLECVQLEETRRRLQEAGLEPFDDTPIPRRPRFFSRDPVGNLIEFTRIEGDNLK